MLRPRQIVRRLHRDERAAALIEATIIFPLLLILTFGLVEFGHAFWRYHAAEKATNAGARWLSTRHGVRGELAPLTNELYTAVVPDCFEPTNLPPGTPCAQVAGATSWDETCSGAGGGACSGAVMSALLTEMQRFAPFLTAANLEVEFQGSAMGYVGRGRAVPLVTVRTTGLTFDFVAMDDLLGLGPITMPSFATTFVAEDQKEGTGI